MAIEELIIHQNLIRSVPVRNLHNKILTFLFMSHPHTRLHIHSHTPDLTRAQHEKLQINVNHSSKNVHRAVVIFMSATTKLTLESLNAYTTIKNTQNKKKL